MIVRILAIDPNPVAGRSDVLCYQVPEKSREYAVLVSALERMGLEFTTLPPGPRKKKQTKQKGGTT